MTNAWSFDPRPDLADDSRLWRYLITAACRRDGGHQGALYGGLRCLRQMGARLVLEDGTARLEAGGVGHAYTIYRKMWLLPHAAVMCELLRLLADAAALDLLDQVPFTTPEPPASPTPPAAGSAPRPAPRWAGCPAPRSLTPAWPESSSGRSLCWPTQVTFRGA